MFCALFICCLVISFCYFGCGFIVSVFVIGFGVCCLLLVLWFLGLQLLIVFVLFTCRVWVFYLWLVTFCCTIFRRCFVDCLSWFCFEVILVVCIALLVLMFACLFVYS